MQESNKTRCVSRNTLTIMCREQRDKLITATNFNTKSIWKPVNNTERSCSHITFYIQNDKLIIREIWRSLCSTRRSPFCSMEFLSYSVTVWGSVLYTGIAVTVTSGLKLHKWKLCKWKHLALWLTQQVWATAQSTIVTV